MKDGLTFNSSVSHRIQSLSIESSILKVKKLPQFYSYSLYFMSSKIPLIISWLKPKKKENNMFNSTILFNGSESNVLTQCLKNYPDIEDNSLCEVQCEKPLSGKSNPVNHIKTILEVSYENTKKLNKEESNE
ncbi:MAG TPA: hypothetical protein P5542_07565 [Candidatus Syntrophosphaera sp.]|nr:hypothetical protein [Candidatus Syntrophosphaera sp.]